MSKNRASRRKHGPKVPVHIVVENKLDNGQYDVALSELTPEQKENFLEQVRKLKEAK